MKIQKLYRIVFLLLIGLSISSCFNKKDSIDFDTLEFDEKIYLFPVNDTTLPFANVEIDYTYPKRFKNKEDLSRLQQIFNGTFFILDDNFSNSQKYDALTPQKALTSFIEDYTENYRQNGNQYYEDMANLEGDDVPSWYWYQMQKKNEILFVDENTLSYSVQHTDYTGGAHGSLKVLYYTINLQKLTTITEEDIFIPNYFNFLTEKIIEQLMQKYKVSSAEELLNKGFFDINEIVPNSNFWLNNEGIHYIYNQYEIAPYSMGPIEITVPYEKIKSIILVDSMVGKYMK